MSDEEKKSSPKEETSRPGGLLKLRPSKIGGGALKSWEENKNSFKPKEITTTLSFTRPTLSFGSSAGAFSKNSTKKDDDAADKANVFGLRLESKLKTFESIAKPCDENDDAEPSMKRRKSDNDQDNISTSQGQADAKDAKAKIEESIDELLKKQQKEDAERQAMLERNTEPVSTGEEGEYNIHNGTGKLYVFEWDAEKKTGSWAQRGPVSLRINKNYRTEHGRIICRAHGNLRVLINSAFFERMTLTKENSKTIKFSACAGESGGALRQFLFKGSEKEVNELFKVMEEERDHMKVASSSSSPRENSEAAPSSLQETPKAAPKDYSS
uniref:RanBD1 domain-containing protein n=1 Tax=Steinernema glaseri TaxID=37863 RepID=A0A1I7ZCJ6_9BILA